MAKSILMSIQPQWVAKILNGEKTIEVRKKFPKDYVGWVYIYCTKGKDYLYEIEDEDTNGFSYKLHKECNVEEWEAATETLNGKVVARFWCNKVEEMWQGEDGGSFFTDTIKKPYKVSELACISDDDIEIYFDGKNGYAIHISKVEVFDKPKELKEFGITKAPQSYMFVEGE